MASPAHLRRVIGYDRFGRIVVIVLVIIGRFAFIVIVMIDQMFGIGVSDVKSSLAPAVIKIHVDVAISFSSGFWWIHRQLTIGAGVAEVSSPAAAWR